MPYSIDDRQLDRDLIAIMRGSCESVLFSSIGELTGTKVNHDDGRGKRTPFPYAAKYFQWLYSKVRGKILAERKQSSEKIAGTIAYYIRLGRHLLAEGNYQAAIAVNIALLDTVRMSNAEQVLKDKDIQYWHELDMACRVYNNERPRTFLSRELDAEIDPNERILRDTLSEQDEHGFRFDRLGVFARAFAKLRETPKTASALKGRLDTITCNFDALLQYGRLANFSQEELGQHVDVLIQLIGQEIEAVSEKLKSGHWAQGAQALLPELRLLQHKLLPQLKLLNLTNSQDRKLYEWKLLKAKLSIFKLIYFKILFSYDEYPFPGQNVDLCPALTEWIRSQEKTLRLWHDESHLSVLARQERAHSDFHFDAPIAEYDAGRLALIKLEDDGAAMRAAAFADGRRALRHLLHDDEQPKMVARYARQQPTIASLTTRATPPPWYQKPWFRRSMLFLAGVGVGLAGVFTLGAAFIIGGFVGAVVLPLLDKGASMLRARQRQRQLVTKVESRNRAWADSLERPPYDREPGERPQRYSSSGSGYHPSGARGSASSGHSSLGDGGLVEALLGDAAVRTSSRDRRSTGARSPGK